MSLSEVILIPVFAATVLGWSGFLVYLLCRKDDDE